MDSSLNNTLETEFTSLNMDDILTEIVYYTGGLEMIKCHMLVTADKIEEITKNLENGIKPDLGKQIKVYYKADSYIKNSAKREGKRILELDIHSDRLLKLYDIGNSERFKQMYRDFKEKMNKSESNMTNNLSSEFAKYVYMNTIPKPSGIATIKNISLSEDIPDIIKYSFVEILITNELIIDNIRLL